MEQDSKVIDLMELVDLMDKNGIWKLYSNAIKDYNDECYLDAYDNLDNSIYDERQYINHKNAGILKKVFLYGIEKGNDHFIYFFKHYIDIFIRDISDFYEILDILQKGLLLSKNKKDFSIGLSELLNSSGFSFELFITLKKDLNNAKSDIQQLQAENKLLKNHILYSPNGPGYKESKDHFNALLDEDK